MGPLTPLLVKVAEIVVPPLIQMVITHLQKKEQTPVVQAKLQAHQDALSALKPTTGTTK